MTPESGGLNECAQNWDKVLPSQKTHLTYTSHHLIHLSRVDNYSIYFIIAEFANTKSLDLKINYSPFSTYQPCAVGTPGRDAPSHDFNNR